MKRPNTPKPDSDQRFGVVRLSPALDGAKVFVDGKPVAAEMLSLDKAKNTLAINGLSPGVHKITYDHPAYAIAERTFNIEAGKEYSWTFAPELSSVELTVISEPGATVYLDKEPLGVVSANGKFKSVGIKIGKHEITLAKDGFQESSETRNFEFNKPVMIERKLVRLMTTERGLKIRVLTAAEFHEDFDRFDPKRWLLPPSGWAIKSGKLSLANTPMMSSPVDARYRDFVMHFYLKLDNAGGAAWAARIKDAKNYYLFYLSGPAGLFPNRFLVYVVRDGKFDPADFVYSTPILTKLAPGEMYDIELEAVKNTFTHRIIPAATGKSEVLGYFQDTKNLFPFGGCGFRTVGSERFSIDDLYVQPR